MNDNVRKIFDMLGVEPNEKFKIAEHNEDKFYITDDLSIIDDKGVERPTNILRALLNGSINIVKLPKIPKKKKLRDLTLEEYKKWLIENCDNGILCCRDCVFRYANCDKHFRWIDRKDLYSDKFLEQEIEVEE